MLLVSTDDHTSRKTGELAQRETVKQLFTRKREVTAEETNAILEKHGLGTATSRVPIQANVMNVICEVATDRAGPLILKAQVRPAAGSLAAEHEVIYTKDYSRIRVSASDLRNCGGYEHPRPHVRQALRPMAGRAGIVRSGSSEMS